MGPGGFVPTNPDPANILGRTDLDFENFYFFGCFWIPKFEGMFGASLGHLLGIIVVLLGLCWHHFGIILGSFWNHVGIMLASCWDHFGIIFRSC